jgi:hypothetical protein
VIWGSDYDLLAATFGQVMSDKDLDLSGLKCTKDENVDCETILTNRN